MGEYLYSSFFLLLIVFIIYGATLFFYNEEDGYNRKLMSLFMLSILFQGVYNFVHFISNETIIIFTEIINVPLILCIPVLAFVYVSKISDNYINTKKHFILPFVFLCLNVLVYFVVPYEDMLLYAKSYFIDYQKLHILPKIIYILGIFIVLPLQLIYYSYKMIVYIRKHQIKILNYYSNTENFNLRWVYFTIFLIIIYFLSGTYLIHNPTDNNFVIYNVVCCVIFYFVFFFSLNQKSIFIPEEFDNDKIKFFISDIEGIELDFFINRDLTIYNLAKRLNTNRTYLSNFLNKEIKKNFSDYINEKRVLYSLKYVEDSNVKIENIYFMSGFKSNSNYYLYFRKKFNMTPLQYRSKK